MRTVSLRSWMMNPAASTGLAGYVQLWRLSPWGSFHFICRRSVMCHEQPYHSSLFDDYLAYIFYSFCASSLSSLPSFFLYVVFWPFAEQNPTHALPVLPPPLLMPLPSPPTSAGCAPQGRASLSCMQHRSFIVLGQKQHRRCIQCAGCRTIPQP